MTLAPGIHTLDAAAYHADQLGDTPTLSCSIAKVLVSASPKHAWANHPRLNPLFEPDADDKFDLGTAAHSLFLEGDGNVEVFTYNDWRSKAAQEGRAEARAHGKTPMLGKDWDRVVAMVDALRSQLATLKIDPPLFTAGQPEVTVVWNEQGVLCRSRLDYLHDTFLAADDLKSTHSANPDTWTRRTMWDIGADLQVAFNCRGVKAVTGIEPEFRFVVIETKPPFELIVVSLEPEARAFAETKVDKALDLWKRCLDTNTWPGYPKDICYASLPPWLETQYLEREAREESIAA